MMDKPKYFSMVALVVLLPIVGSTIMYFSIYAVPMTDHPSYRYVVYTALVIALGLLVPYFMLKAFSIAAHQWDPREKELHMKDLPKDKDQAK
jgi:hypothetical protein